LLDKVLFDEQQLKELGEPLKKSGGEYLWDC
jgi:hypothetical protein